MLYVFIAIWFIWWIFAFIKPKWIAFRIPAVAMTIAPFIVYNKKYYKNYIEIYGETRLRNHEMRHVWQQRIFSPLAMLILYLLFYLIQFVYFSIIEGSIIEAHKLAYRNNPFEIDARKHE
jgi:peptidoglycan/LPS O-acetylase OafA/YrhL